MANGGSSAKDDNDENFASEAEEMIRRAVRKMEVPLC